VDFEGHCVKKKEKQMEESMRTDRSMSRRGFARMVLTPAAGAAAAAGASAAIRPKAAGETLVVYLGGDQLHNGLGQRQSLRSIFQKAGWRFVVAQDARFLTPNLVKEADLLALTRWGGPIEGISTDGVFEGAQPDDGYMSDELEAAIVDNVRRRGMGFLSLHCTAWTPDKPKFLELLGIKPIMHGPVQPVRLHNFNQEHPITQGIQDYELGLDENFGVILTNPEAVRLFESTGQTDKRHDIAGWCVEQDKGRVVGLVAGHNEVAWRNKTYRMLYWRAAHWALRRPIPPFEG
jgi:hypothetical protein